MGVGVDGTIVVAMRGSTTRPAGETGGGGWRTLPWFVIGVLVAPALVVAPTILGVAPTRIEYWMSVILGGVGAGVAQVYGGRVNGPSLGKRVPGIIVWVAITLVMLENIGRVTVDPEVRASRVFWVGMLQVVLVWIWLNVLAGPRAGPIVRSGFRGYEADEPLKHMVPDEPIKHMVRVPILDAAWEGDLDALRECLREHHPDAAFSIDGELLESGSAGRTALHAAIENGRPRIVEALLAAGASPDLRDETGWTPCFHAIEMVLQLAKNQDDRPCAETDDALAEGIGIARMIASRVDLDTDITDGRTARESAREFGVLKFLEG